jgi:hypothetical protein
LLLGFIVARMQPLAPLTGEAQSRKLVVRRATPLEVFNIPLFEIPPMMDVRSEGEFEKSHILCAVSVPLEDGPDVQRLCQRMHDHDEQFGWSFSGPLVIVHDASTFERASWLVDIAQSVMSRAETHESDESYLEHSLLRRCCSSCQEVLVVSHQDFATPFDFCCKAGAAWHAATFFDGYGPLPRCASLHPRVFLAGRQVKYSKDMLELLGVTHVVVNADVWDVIDGTSGGGPTMQHPCNDRMEDVQDVSYLKCDIPDREDDQDLLQVLQGTAVFLQGCANKGGTALVRMHGQSRSAAVMCAFLMLSRCVSVEVAWKQLCVARVQVDPCLMWWDALRRLEQARRKRALEDGSALAAA